jgi:hypothetical protein
VKGKLPFPAKLYLSAKVARTFFRMLKKEFNDPHSRTWAKLRLVFLDQELLIISNFFRGVACPYSYDRNGQKRQKAQMAESLLSKLCYRVNKQAQDTFLRDPLLTHAVIVAFEAQIAERNFTSASEATDADVLDKFIALARRYEAEVHPQLYSDF